MKRIVRLSVIMTRGCSTRLYDTLRASNVSASGLTGMRRAILGDASGLLVAHKACGDSAILNRQPSVYNFLTLKILSRMTQKLRST